MSRPRPACSRLVSTAVVAALCGVVWCAGSDSPAVDAVTRGVAALPGCVAQIGSPLRPWGPIEGDAARHAEDCPQCQADAFGPIPGKCPVMAELNRRNKYPPGTPATVRDRRQLGEEPWTRKRHHDKISSP